jgi:bisphosphoglycerate-dependent phosphoglycerate mutase
MEIEPRDKGRVQQNGKEIVGKLHHYFESKICPLLNTGRCLIEQESQ